jgi:hypothetical protein
LQSATPQPLTLEYTIKLNQLIAQKVELMAHFRLKDKCISGEWFTVSIGEAKRTIEEIIDELACVPSVHLMARSENHEKTIHFGIMLTKGRITLYQEAAKYIGFRELAPWIRMVLDREVKRVAEQQGRGDV